MARRQPGAPPQLSRAFACLTVLGYAIYPILQFYSQNRGYTTPQATIRSFVVSIVAASLVLAVGLAITDVRRTAVSLSVFLLMLALYQGGLQALLPRESLGAWFYLSASIIAAILVWRVGAASRNAIGITAGIIVVVLLFSAGFEVATSRSSQDRERWANAVALSEKGPATPARGTGPDIYYIVLDGFGRSDVLEHVYGVDNSAFVEFLGTSGFYVADLARSNYAQTLLSVSSSLNMAYLSGIADIMRDKDDRSPVLHLTRYNHVVRILRDAGYRMTFIGSDFTPLATSPLADDCFCRIFGLSEFEAVLLSRTPFWVPAIDRGLMDGHRQKVLYAFDRLAAVPESDAPRFVMAHIMAPHPPFVFDRSGGTPTRQPRSFTFADGTNFIGSRAEYISGYREQVQFITAKLRRVIETVLAHRTGRDVVMILQGDHGPGSMTDWESAERTDLRERLSIFSAYRLPGGQAALYRSITPVNSFRVVLAKYLGLRLDVLKDESYFSTWNKPYAFVRAPVEDAGTNPASSGLENR